MPSPFERAFLEIATARDVEPSSLAALLARSGVPEDDARALLASGADRLLSYRARVRSTLRSLLQTALPRTVERLGDRFEGDFASFLAESAPRAEYLRAVVRDFIDHASSGWRASDVPPFVVDLANLEALHLEVAAAPRTARADIVAELALELPVRFIVASRVVHYSYAVHELPAAPGDRTSPPERAVSLFVYRDALHDIRYLELTPLAADVLSRLRERGEPLRTAILEACSAHAVAPASIVASTSELLSELASRGALLGSGCTPPTAQEAH